MRAAAFLFGAVLATMAAACLSVAPDVLARCAELEPFHGRVALAGYAMATLGGLAMGAGFMAAAVRSRG